MKSILVTVLLIGSMLSTVQAQDSTQAQFLLDFRPGSFLISPDLDGLTVRNASNTYRETVSGGGSWTPSLNAGLGLDFGKWNMNITAGPGYLWNGAFHGAFWQADLGILFELANGKFRIGPHVGVLGLGDATWDSIDSSGYTTQDPQADLSGSTGFKGGLTLHAGGEKVAFLMNFDVVDANYDITTKNGWVAEDDDGNTVSNVDMSGFIIDMGLIIRF